MKYILFIYLSFSITVSFSQKFSLKELKGIWVGNLSQSDYKIINRDTMISIGLVDTKMIVFAKNKIGFIDRNNSELLRSFRKKLGNFNSSEIQLVNYILPDSLIYLVQSKKK